MNDFNAKKARAQKLRQDKHHDRPKKHTNSGTQSSKGESKGVNQAAVFKGLNSNLEKQREAGSESDGEQSVKTNTQSFSKRKLVNNWDRYEEATDLHRFEDDVDHSAASFEELLSMPISGGHLKLKHEQHWDQMKSELQTPWFQLDIQTLEKNLSTVPFQKRQNLPPEIFSGIHLQRMETRAKRNAVSLSEINETILKINKLTTCNENKKSADSNEKNSRVVKNESPLRLNIPQTDDSLEKVESDELDQILNLHESPSKSSNASTEPVEVIGGTDCEDSVINKSNSSIEKGAVLQTSPTSQPSVSLDDWLDSILDD